MNNLAWGLQVTALGMGLVFALLGLLWGLLHLVLRLDKSPAAPVPAEISVANAERIAAVADDAIGAQIPIVRTVNGMDADLVAAIMIATLTHKAVRRGQAAPVMRSFWPGSLLYASRWVASGRARQNSSWQRGGR